MRRYLFFLLLLVLATSTGMFFSCHKDNPVTPPIQPGHAAITFQVTFTSTRWCRLWWSNDSAAVSHRYVLIRDDRDTLYNDSMIAGVATKILQDTVLKPGSNYSYWIFRVVNGQHWDSTTVNVRTLDTTKDDYRWEKIKLGGPNSALFGVWGSSPNSVWLCGGFDIKDSGQTYDIAHWADGKLTFISAFGALYGCYGISDSLIWFATQNALIDWNGKSFTPHVFNGDSIFNLSPIDFNSVWISPDGREVFGVGVRGSIVHRKADGKTWEKIESGTTLSLGSIVGFSPSDIYFSGGYSNYEGILVHYDGKSCTTVLHSIAPHDSVCNVAAMSVWGESADSLMLSGNGVFHLKGTKWEDRSPNGLYTNAYMYCVRSLGWNNAIVCGAFGLLAHFDGEKWKVYPDFFSSGTTLSLNNIWMGGGEVFVVGDDENGACFIRGK